MEINGFGGASLVLWSPRCDFQPPHIGIFDAAQVMGANIPGINDEEAKSAGGGIMEEWCTSMRFCCYHLDFARPVEVKPIRRQWKKRAWDAGAQKLSSRGHLCPKKGKGQFVNDVQRGRRLIDTVMWPLFWVIRDEILLWSSLSRLVICSKDSHQWIWGKRSKNGFGGGLAGWCFSVFVSHPPWDPKLSSDWTGTEGIAKKGVRRIQMFSVFFNVEWNKDHDEYMNDLVVSGLLANGRATDLSDT